MTKHKTGTTSKERDKEHGKGHLAMNTPPIVSEQEWEAARQQLLVKEKALTRSRDALAAKRRRMPWMAVEKNLRLFGADETFRICLKTSLNFTAYAVIKFQLFWARSE